jgi:hypothetical protein
MILEVSAGEESLFLLNLMKNIFRSQYTVLHKVIIRIKSLLTVESNRADNNFIIVCSANNSIAKKAMKSIFIIIKRMQCEKKKRLHPSLYGIIVRLMPDLVSANKKCTQLDIHFFAIRGSSSKKFLGKQFCKTSAERKLKSVAS